MGKTSEAAVYRKYINSMKKKTKKMNEGIANNPPVPTLDLTKIVCANKLLSQD